MISMVRKISLILILFLFNVNCLLAQGRPFKIGFFSIFMAAPFIYAEQTGVFNKEGLEVKIIRYKSLMEMAQDFHQGKIDGAIFPIPMVFSYRLGLLPDIPAEKVKVVLIAGVNGGSLVVIDPSIKNPKDLKGKMVASFDKKCPCYPLLRYFLIKYGIDPEKEAKHAVFSFDDLKNYILEQMRLAKAVAKNRDNKELVERYRKMQKISAFLLTEPNTSFIKQATKGIVMASTRNIWRDHPSGGLVVKENDLNGKQAILEKIIGIIGKVSLTLDQPQNRDTLVKVLLKTPYIPPEFTYPVLREAFKAGVTDYLVFPYKSSAIAWIEILKELKMLPSNVDSYRLGEEIFASEFARAALKKAGVPVPPSDYRPEVIMGEVKNFRR